MEIILNKRPKNPIIIQGFPGFGLVGTIATEFLMEHLKVEQIGKITIDEMNPVVAVHDHKIVDPLGIFYNKKYNLVILHAITATQGLEWKIADLVVELAKKLQVKEIISVEGMGGESKEPKSYYYSKDKRNSTKLKKIGIAPLKEGIIIGITGAVLLKSKIPVSCIFTETHSNLPDSKAAAKIIEALDKYLGLKVDYKPLLAQAETFENKLQDIMKKGVQATEISEKKRMSYVG